MADDAGSVVAEPFSPWGPPRHPRSMSSLAGAGQLSARSPTCSRSASCSTRRHPLALPPTPLLSPSPVCYHRQPPARQHTGGPRSLRPHRPAARKERRTPGIVEPSETTSRNRAGSARGRCGDPRGCWPGVLPSPPARGPPCGLTARAARARGGAGAGEATVKEEVEDGYCWPGLHLHPQGLTVSPLSGSPRTTMEPC